MYLLSTGWRNRCCQQAAVWATPADGTASVLQQPVLLRGLDEAQMVRAGPAAVFLSSRNPRGLGVNYPQPSPADRMWGRRLYARSTNGGRDFFDVAAIDAGVVDPRSQGSIVGTRAGEYYLSHDSSWPAARRNLTVRAAINLTGPTGPQWGPATSVEPGAAAYSSLSAGEDGSLGLLYERGAPGCESPACALPHSPLGKACSSCRITFRLLAATASPQQ